MQLDNTQQEIIDACLSRIEMRRGNTFTGEQLDRIYEVAEMQFASILAGLTEMSADEQDQRVEGIVRLALIAFHETIPVPDELTADFLARTPDDELSQLLFD